MELPQILRLKKILKYFLVFLSSILLLCVLLFFLVYSGIFGILPGKKELKAINNEEASLVISSDSVIIGKFFAENRTTISNAEIPDHLKNALIATEDKRFFTHNGYDLQSYFRVFFKSILWGESTGGGGSTLTQQLVKNLYGRPKHGILSMPVNKIKEIIIAARIEEVYNKDEVLLLYLNSVPFGEDVYGVEAASHRYFNKPVRKLKVEESAVLVGLLKANTYFNPRINPQNSLERRNMVLSLMEKEKYLTKAASDSLRKLPLNLNYENMNAEAPAGYFVYQVKKKTLEILEDIQRKGGGEYDLKKDGLKIYTTLNMHIQQITTEGIHKHLYGMQKLLDKELQNRNIKKRWYRKQFKLYGEDNSVKKNIEVFDWKGIVTKRMNKTDSLWYYYKLLNASVLITNPKDGAVITWIGGNDFKRLPFDMVMSHRQIASAFKPFLYATALENNFTPSTYLKNIQKVYPEYKNWEPQNFDHKFTKDSTVALWYALANSMNLPTLDLYFQTGREKLINTCNKLHFPYTNDDSPSIALGTLDLSLYEVVRAYGAFANRGEMAEPVMINKITDAKGTVLFERKDAQTEKVFNAETTEMITAILQKAINQGTGTRIRNQFGIRADLAGKTGTAQDYTNAWFIAYTPNLVVGTWVGATSPEIHFYSGNGSGSSLALPIVGNVLRAIENNAGWRRQFLTSFTIPASVYDELNCDPYKETGVKGFFYRLFHRKKK
ncbi:MAG TPA: transglycosylase domain-containing protein [Paludibacter sp.]|nr:transglycosylase domain-containing protein [Paludibacter sp.]